MLQELYIKNYRSLKEATLEFIEGINVIVGVSDSGKTNILRLLETICENRPIGFRYHSDFASEGESTIGRLKVDGSVIEFNKSEKEVFYKLDGEKFEVFKFSVPDVIRDKINLSDINIADEDQVSFLIGDPPGKVAKEFNKILNIENADEWISSFTTDVNLCKRDRDKNKKRIEEIEVEIKKYEDKLKAERLVFRLERMEGKLQNVKDNIDEMNLILNDISDCEKELASLIDIEKAKELFIKLDEHRIKKESIWTDKEEICRFIDLSKKIRNYRNVEKAEKLYIRLDNGRKELDTAKKQYDELYYLIMEIRSAEKELTKVKRIHYEAIENYVDKVREIKVCPVCGNEDIDESCISNLLEEFS